MIHYFPEEIIHDILYRLPIKCLIKCTSVCKPWRSMIINPSFIHAHLSRTIKSNDQDGTHLLLLHRLSNADCSNTGHKVFISNPREELYSLHYDNQAFEEYCKIEFSIAHKEVFYTPCFRVVGLCNGLVCLADDIGRSGYTFIIWNPLIRKSVTLPRPNVTTCTHGSYNATIGFGFDAMTNDYKVVRLVTGQEDNPTLVEVYTLATGSWSSPSFVSPKCKIDGCAPQAFVNGALHWVARRLTNGAYYLLILAFDLGNESFREIMMPKSFQGKISLRLRLRLSVSGDGKSIALFIMDPDCKDSFLDIWVMKEYCKEESWTKLITLGPQGAERRLPKALCFRKSGKVVLVLTKTRNLFEQQLKDKNALVSLDLVSQKFKNLGISGDKYYSLDSYEESLVLLDKTDAISY